MTPVADRALEPSLPARLEIISVTLLVMLASAGASQLLALWRVLWVGITAGRNPGGRALLVPGKKLLNGSPDLDFRLRLDAAHALSSSAQVVVLLGGATTDHARSEALAGQNYLLARSAGLQEKLVLEQESATTFENFRYARELLGREQQYAVLSNRYHLARCLSQARSLDMDVIVLAAEAGLRLPPLACLRETWFLHLFVVGSLWAKLRRHRELLAYLD